ncbi:hypothetical protein HDV57DRAFT_278479 [Trichoderma longibrachiatum]
MAHLKFWGSRHTTSPLTTSGSSAVPGLRRPALQRPQRPPKAAAPQAPQALPAAGDQRLAVLVSPENPASDKIVRPRLAAPLFPMHTFYQLGLTATASQTTPESHLVSSIGSVVVRDHASALNLRLQHAPVPWIRTSSHPRPVLCVASASGSQKLIFSFSQPVSPVQRASRSSPALVCKPSVPSLSQDFMANLF